MALVSFIFIILFCYRKMVVRTYQDELKYLEKVGPCAWRIKKGFVDNMNVRKYMTFETVKILC